MDEHGQLNRRDFLGLTLFGLPAAAAVIGSPSDGRRPIYRGTMRELMAGILPGADWRARYYALVESVETPPSAWRVKKFSALAMLHARRREELPELLRSHRVIRLCEADVSPRSGGPDAPSCFADVTVFADEGSCQAAWRVLDERVAVGEADAHPGGLGDAACLGNKASQWTLPGKIFFRRANVAATVLVMPTAPGFEAERFAADIDRGIAAHLC